nr:hypothetical protein [uncultured Celeribacter sp.]
MTVVKLRPSETVELDHALLENLYQELGTKAADSVVLRAMEELAVRLSKIDRNFKAGQIEDVRHAARSMVAVAEQIGMVTFARVANDVTGLAARHDDAGLAAAVERLMRIGENSLLAVWDLQGVSL